MCGILPRHSPRHNKTAGWLFFSTQDLKQGRGHRYIPVPGTWYFAITLSLCLLFHQVGSICRCTKRAGLSPVENPASGARFPPGQLRGIDCISDERLHSPGCQYSSTGWLWSRVSVVLDRGCNLTLRLRVRSPPMPTSVCPVGDPGMFPPRPP